jgi:predicted secreted Zn-dependent protease
MGGRQAARAFAIGVILASAAWSIARAEDGAISAPPTGGSTETIIHYDVRGRTLDEVRADVFQWGPYDEASGQRFAGWTAWSIQWHYDVTVDDDGCHIRDVTTSTEISYTLPRWLDEARASADLQKAWRRFHAALVGHEKGHGQLARELAGRIEKAMTLIPPKPTCEELEVEVNDLGTMMIVTDDKQAAYDRRTAHGEKQGAAFPRVLVRRAGAPPAFR